jgi:hypothetical protein
MAKRARERARQDRKEAKRIRRDAAASALDTGFSDEAYQLERHRIFVALGIETEDDA